MRRCTVFAFLLFVACSSTRVPVTYDLIKRYGLKPEELKNLQYYVSEEITLRREVESGDREVSQYRLKTREGKLIEEIVVKSSTPAIAVGVGENTLALSFEQGQSLTFGSDPKYRRRWQGKYTLFAREWRGGVGVVNYAGKSYMAVEDSGDAYLMIDMDSLENVVHRRRVLEGRKLDPKE